MPKSLPKGAKVPYAVGVQKGERFTHPEYPRLALFLRTSSRFYQAQTYLDGKLKQKSLKTADVALALKLSVEWYKRELRASVDFGRQHPIDKAADPILAEIFKSYLTTLAPKQQAEAKKRWGPIQHFWRALKLRDVTSEQFEKFYQWRKVKAHTLHKDICTLRQMLRYAETRTGSGFVTPRIPKHGRIESNPRPWLSEREWEILRQMTVTGVSIATEDRRERTARQRQDAFDFAAFMVASMCRVEELQNLRFSHCVVEKVERREILRCEFKGKTGPRIAYAAPEAVTIYRERLKRAGDPTAFVFESHHRDAFRELLVKAGLYVDHFGNKRNYKAMRATAIALALLRPNPPSVYQIALNAGTSVAVIEKFYAKRLTAEHGKDVLTAAEPLPSMFRKRKG